jgi:hypothetical protein
MITQEIMDKLVRVYGNGMARIIVYADWSGHTEVRDGRFWVKDFSFEDVQMLLSYLNAFILFANSNTE